MYGLRSSNCHRVFAICQLNKVPDGDPVIYKYLNCIRKKYKMSITDRMILNIYPEKNIYLFDAKISNVLNTSDDDSDIHGFKDTPLTPFNVANGKDSKISYVDMINCNNKHNEDDNISNEQILEIYFEALNVLQKCENKYDKTKVLRMLLKHVIWINPETNVKTYALKR